MIRLVTLALLACLLGGDADDAVAPDPSKGTGGKAGTFPDLKIDVDGTERSYRIVVPEKVKEDGAVPLVFAFHGLLDSKDLMPRYTKLDELAKEEGFILVFPNGIDRHWPIDYENAERDFAFFDALYERITERYDVDRNRVYLTGMSNGAIFSYLLAARRSEKIAAIAPHSGWLGEAQWKGLKASHKFPVMIVHGAEDWIILPVAARIARDVCRKEGHRVEWVMLEGFGHFWAEAEHGINARIWEFFVKNPRDPSGEKAAKEEEPAKRASTPRSPSRAGPPRTPAATSAATPGGVARSPARRAARRPAPWCPCRGRR